MRRLTEKTEDFKIISVVGNSKNAGKTTVINSILEDLDYNNIAITSIGLDGEKIDQVTFMEKPRIYVREGYIIATALDTLKQFEAEYETLQMTDIFTSIGMIVIVKIKKAGNALIAGPSVVFDMEKILLLLTQFNLKKIFIDGAFFRHSLAKISGATILVVGANLSPDIDTVLLDFELTNKKFNLPKIDEKFLFLQEKSKICFVSNQGDFIDLGFDTVIGNTVEIFEFNNSKYRFLYLPKALTNDFLLNLIESRNDFHYDIILESPINIQLNLMNLKHLFKLKNQLFVINPTNLVAVCYNPFSPRGYEFNNLVFKEKLEDIYKSEVFNVKEGVTNE